MPSNTLRCWLEVAPCEQSICRPRCPSLKPVQSARQLTEFDATTDLYDRLLGVVEPPLLQAILSHCGHNRAAAAQKLGLHRGTLRQKLKQHGIDK